MDQNSIVVMPALKRPEFLALSLESIARSNAPSDVRIFLDTCTDLVADEVDYVRDLYLPRAKIFRVGKHVEAPSGCWNILHALDVGYRSGADYVFLVEEDVRVYPDFFDWSLETHRSTFCFATCGRRHKFGDGYYTNPGACFHSCSLASVVFHINEDFFANRREYMDLCFGKMDEASDLDDGLIRRVIRSSGQGGVVYPTTPKVAHQGFKYFNVLSYLSVEGTIQERIQRLRVLLDTISSKDRYTRDFEKFTNFQGG